MVAEGLAFSCCARQKNETQKKPSNTTITLIAWFRLSCPIAITLGGCSLRELCAIFPATSFGGLFDET